MGFSLKKLFTPPKAVRSLVEAIPGVGQVLKAGQAIGGILEGGKVPAVNIPFMPLNLTRPTGLAAGGGPCPTGTYPAFSALDMIYKCMPIPGQGTPAAPGMPMPTGDMAGLTPYAVQAYCAGATGLGKVKLMPSPCRGYHWNESRYYVFGNPCRGTSAGPVERGTRLVRNRRINPANAQAARRAVRRLNGTYSLLRSIEKSMVKLGGRSIRAARSASKRRCGCKGACKCG